MAFGIERRNVRSELSLQEDYSCAAHTRGRSVLRPLVPVVPTPDSPSTNNEPEVWKGSMIDRAKMQSVMNQASRDCIKEGKRHKFRVFMDTDVVNVKGKRIRKAQDCSVESESEGSDIEEEPDPVTFDEEEKSHHIKTAKYGNIPFQTAEALLLNGGKSVIGTKSRKARFTSDVYSGITSDITSYKQPFCGCTDALHVGKVCSLPKNSDTTKKVRGKISYISYANVPLKFYCSSHSVVGSKSKPVIWLFVKDGYVRCEPC